MPLTLYTRAAALHDPLHLIEGRHRRITGSRHRQRTMCAATVHCPLCALVVEEAVDEAGGEGVSPTYAVEDFEVGHGACLMEFTLVVADCTPVVHAGCLCMAQGRGHHFEVWK